MFDHEQRIRELEKDVAVMKADVQRMRDRWGVFEETWTEVVIEFCKEFKLDVPASCFK